MSNLNRRALLAGLFAAGALPGAAWADALSPRRPPIRGVNRPEAPLLSAQELIARANLGAQVSYQALDLATGQVIATREAGASLAPASTLKAVTALYALAQLGPAHRFATRVIRAGDMIVLAGGADPELDSDALADLVTRAVAAEKAAEKTTGRPAPARFGVWGGALPRIAEISTGQAAHLAYNPTISGLILNFNRVYLGWRRAGGGYDLSVEARGAHVSPKAYTIKATAADRSAPLFTYDATGAGESWTIAKGAMGRDGSRWLPVRKPELYAGDAFQTLARAAGLALPAPEMLETLPEGVELARHESAPLVDLARRMMKYSNNLTAEVLGLSASGKGNLRDSAEAMRGWLGAHGVGEGAVFFDHSGLSPRNRVSAQMMAGLMAGLGESRHLRGLMKEVSLTEDKGQSRAPILIEAKTGTLNFVSNLAGYAEDGGGRRIAFAILMGDEGRRAASEGRERPEGVLAWTKRAKTLQKGLIELWLASPAQTPGLETSQGAVAGAG